MNRLQKKCLIAVAGTHFLLVVVLFCSGFISSKPKPDDSQVLTMIPDQAIDQLLQSGVRHAEPPPPTPVVQPPPQPQQEPPKPVVEPPKPVEPVKPEPEAQVAKAEEPVETKPKTEPHKVEVNLKPVVHKTSTETNNNDEAAKAEARRERIARAKAVQKALNAIEKNATSATTVDMPGDSTVAYANYASIVKTVYTEAWRLPNDAASDDANVKVSVTIARDGHVIEAHIVDRSGDASVDRSIQETLDRVTEIRPFPDDSTDKERTYIINFNQKAKRMLG